MYYTVYKITNLLNDKIYIGVHKTSNLDDEYIGSGNAIRSAIKKYGRENFIKEYLAVFDNSDAMFEMESKIVNEEFISRKDVYNIKCGGFGGWPPTAAAAYMKLKNENPEYRKRAEKQARKNLETARLRRKADPELDATFREQCRLAFKGRTHTEESKQAIGKANSAHQQGTGNSQYGTMWITDGIRNKKMKRNAEIPDNWKIGRKIT